MPSTCTHAACTSQYCMCNRAMPHNIQPWPVKGGHSCCAGSRFLRPRTPSCTSSCPRCARVQSNTLRAAVSSCFALAKPAACAVHRCEHASCQIVRDKLSDLHHVYCRRSSAACPRPSCAWTSTWTSGSSTPTCRRPAPTAARMAPSSAHSRWIILRQLHAPPGLCARLF